MTQPKPNNNSISSMSPKEIWDKCLAIIKDNVNWRAYQTWFEPITAVAIENGVITIQVPSQFFYEWLEEHYVELLGKTIKRVLGKNGGLAYRIQMESPARSKPATMDLPASSIPKPSKDNNFVDVDYVLNDPRQIMNPHIIPGMKRLQINPQLNVNKTFDNYIEGDCNRVVRSAGMHIAKQPGTTSFNPMLVFGSTSCGKTHLLQAIGNYTRHLHPNKTILYVSADKFINQFVEHSKNNEVNDFIHFYQMIDVLLIDDIHLFVNAPKTQDVFFSIFNHLQLNGKQIVLTSDTPAKDMDGMQERLLGRFRWGLHAEITLPDFETRKAILEMRMKSEGLDIKEEVVQYIAYNIQDNIRDLEGIVVSLFAQSTLNRKEIDIELAKNVMKNFIKNNSRELSIADIQKMVCTYYNIPYDDLMSKKRHREIVQARQIAMYFAKKFTKSSLKTIGSHFSGKDHTTVIHSCSTVSDLMDTDDQYKEKLLELQQKIHLATL